MTGSTQNETSLAAFIPEIWGQKVNDYFRADLVAGNFFTNRSDELRGGGDILKTPGLTAMTSNTKLNNYEVTLNNATEAVKDLTVTTWKEVSFLIEDREASTMLSSYSLMERYMKNAAYESAEALEATILTLFSEFNTTVGASTADLADSLIRSSIASLETSATPGLWEGDVAFFMHPNTFWKQVQNLDKFSLAVNSPVNDPTAKKPKGYLYGIPVYTTPNITSVQTTRYNALAHKDAIHWAARSLGSGGSKGAKTGTSGVRVQANYIPEALGTLVTADICYGAVTNRFSGGVRIMTPQ